MHEYAARAQDADMDALTQYLRSPEGSRYVAFQSELRSISNQGLESLMAQEPIAAEEPGEGRPSIDGNCCRWGLI